MRSTWRSSARSWAGRSASPTAQRWIITVLGLATAAWLHAFHDTLPLILSRVLGQPDAAVGAISRLLADLVNWLGLLTLAVVVVLAWRREARILAIELKDEVATGVVSEADYATITSFGGRLGRQGALLRTSGLGRGPAPPPPLRRRGRAGVPQVAAHGPQPEAAPRGARRRAPRRDPRLADELPGGAA